MKVARVQNETFSKNGKSFKEGGKSFNELLGSVRCRSRPDKISEPIWLANANQGQSSNFEFRSVGLFADRLELVKRLAKQ